MVNTYVSLYNSMAKMVGSIGSRGQLSPINIIGFFVIIVVVATMMQPILDMITIATNSTDPVTTTILNLLPLFLVLGVVITLFSYAQPRYAG